MGEARVDDVTRLAAATSSKDPHVGLAAVAALRALVEVLEALQVDNARAKEANRLRHGYVGPEHVLLGIVRHSDSRAARVLLAHGLDLAGDPPAVEADALGQHEVGPEHVLLGVLRDAAALRGDPRPSRRAKRTWAHLGRPDREPARSGGWSRGG